MEVSKEKRKRLPNRVRMVDNQAVFDVPKSHPNCRCFPVVEEEDSSLATIEGIVIPSHEEWIGLNLLDRDGELKVNRE